MTSKDSDFVAAVNFMLEQCRSTRRINSLEEFESAVVVELCEQILGRSIQGVLRDASGSSDESFNVQLVVDTLATDVLQTDLSHITGENVVAKDKTSLRNLIEIFSVLMEVLLEATEVATGQGQSPNDSNALSSDAMSLVSSVLQEELGHGYRREALKCLRQTAERKRNLVDTSSDTDLSSPSAFAQSAPERVQVISKVKSRKEQLSSGSISSSWPDSEQEASVALGHAIQQVPSVSSITSDLSENAQPSIRKTISGVVRPVSSTPRKASQALVQEEREQQFAANNALSRNKQEMTELVNEALEVSLSQHTLSSCEGSTSSLICLEPKQTSANKFIATNVSKLADVHDTTNQFQASQQPNTIEGHHCEDQLQPQTITVPQIAQQRETQSSATQTEITSSSVPELPPSHLDADIQKFNREVNQTQASTSESSKNSSTSHSSHIIDHETYHKSSSVSHVPPDTATHAQHIVDVSCGSKHTTDVHRVSQVTVEPSDKNQEPEQYVLTADKDDLHVGFKEESPSVQSNPQTLGQSIAAETNTMTKLKQLEAAVKRSEAAGEVMDLLETRRQLSFEDALQRDRTAVLRKVYNCLLKDCEQQQQEINKHRRKESNERKKRRVAFHAHAGTIKPTRPSRASTSKRSGHGQKTLVSPYSQAVVGTKVRCQRQPKCSSTDTPYCPLSGSSKVQVRDNELLPLLVDEFPFLYVSRATVQQMWRKQMKRIQGITRAELGRSSSAKVIVQLEEAEHKQRALLKLMKKDVDHTRRLHEQQERDRQMQYVKSRLQEKRQSSARAKRYYDDYVVQMRTRQMKRRTKEEQIFKKLFEDGLEMQKARLRELKEYYKEGREKQAKQQQDEIESLENYYKDQFAMLAESIMEERQQMQIREDAQAKVVDKMKRELRSRMEKEIKEIQEAMIRDEDDAYFRQLDADRLRQRLQTVYYHTKL